MNNELLRDFYSIMVGDILSDKLGASHNTNSDFSITCKRRNGLFANWIPGNKYTFDPLSVCKMINDKLKQDSNFTKTISSRNLNQALFKCFDGSLDVTKVIQALLTAYIGKTDILSGTIEEPVYVYAPTSPMKDYRPVALQLADGQLIVDISGNEYVHQRQEPTVINVRQYAKKDFNPDSERHILLIQDVLRQTDEKSKQLLLGVPEFRDTFNKIKDTPFSRGK